MASGTNVPATIPHSAGSGEPQPLSRRDSQLPPPSRRRNTMLAKRFRGASAILTRRPSSSPAILRLVAKIAMGYRGYGLPVTELICEGNIGLMQGVKKFEADRGFRLATYAMWWIRASIQEYHPAFVEPREDGHHRAAQKKLFFNLRRMKSKLDAFEDGDLRPEHVAKIAKDLGVTEDEVNSMNRRMAMGGDTSLEHGRARGWRRPVAGLAGGRRIRCRTSASPKAEEKRCAPRPSGRGDGRAQRARKAYPHRAPPDRRARRRSRSSARSMASAGSVCARSRCAPSTSCKKAMMKLAGAQRTFLAGLIRASA